MPDEEKSKMVKCPCCGQETLKHPVKCDSAIVDDYLASILTGVPFKHTFHLFDGKLRITVSASDREEAMKLYRFVFMTESSNISSNNSVRDLLGIVNAYCSIQEIYVQAKEDAKTYFPAQHIVKICGALADKWEDEDLTTDENKTAFLDDLQKAYTSLSKPEILSSTPPMIITRVANDFRGIETILLEAGFDENFWQGIELA